MITYDILEKAIEAATEAKQELLTIEATPTQKQR